MYELFIQGGVQFMSLLTLELLALTAIAIVTAIRVLSFDPSKTETIESNLNYIKSVAILALVTGILGQLIGLYSAFDFISQQGSVSQDILARGIKVSSITTLYGLTIFIIGQLVWLGLDMTFRKKKVA